MKLNIHLAPDPVAGSGKKAAPVMVKVRNNTTRPLAVDGIVLQPRVLDKTGKVTKEAPESEVPEKHLDRLGNWVTKVAAILAFLIIGSSVTLAQQYKFTYIPITNGSSILLNGQQTNAVSGALAAGATNQVNVIIGVTKYDDISLFFGSTPQSGSTSNNVVYLDQSLTGTNNWWPLAQVSWNDAGTAASGQGTNIIMKATGYLRVTQWASPTSLVIKSNLVGIWAVKPSRSGS